MHVVGERYVKVGVVIEIDDEYLVLRIRRTHHGERRRFNADSLALHAAAVVNDDSERNRNVLASENFDLLQLPVLENSERVPVEVSNQFAFLISHAGMQHHQPRIGAKLGK